MTGNGLTKHARMERLRFTEEVMSRRFSRRGVELALEAEFGISARTARRYIRAVRRQWELEAQQSRPRVRAEIRAKLLSLYEIALDRVQRVEETFVEDGEKNRRAVYYRDPDMRAALLILDRLAQLEGLDQPQVIEVHSAPASPAISPEDAKAKLRAITGGK